MASGSPKKMNNAKYKAAHARVGSTLTNGGEDPVARVPDEGGKKHNNTIKKKNHEDDTIDQLDKEVEAITKKEKKNK